MCGIAGVIGGRSASSENVARMLEAVSHRGREKPCLKGFHSEGGRSGVALGSVRLPVMDPENGSDAIASQDGSIRVSFNGEIFNHLELKAELKSKGHQFRTECDTEVLLHLWKEEGERMLSRLNGMFAFFLWDDQAKRGILARDRLGIKPCFLADFDGGHAFCSEIKGILTLPGFARSVDEGSVVGLFAFNYPVPPRTCFKGVRHLEPGTFLKFEEGKPPTSHRYWQLPLGQLKQAISFGDFAALLDDATRLQMRFDVPAGLFLSGGVDSSVVAAHLRKFWPRPRLDAFTIDVEPPGFSELGFAREVADRYELDLSSLRVTASEVSQHAAEVVRFAEQPHGDFSFFAFYAICREAAHKGKVVMFYGDGPDEMLLGLPQNSRFFSSIGVRDYSAGAYFKHICYMAPEVRTRVFRSDFLKNAEDPWETFSGILEPWKELSPIDQIAGYELSSLWTGNSEVKTDRMGARWLIEGRSPFFDHRVCEVLCRLPDHDKLSGGVGKHFLKRYAAQFFGEAFAFRPKTMPTLPIGEWIKGSLYSWARELLQTEDSVFNSGALTRMLDEHRAGSVNHTSHLRTALMTKLWLKTFWT